MPLVLQSVGEWLVHRLSNFVLTFIPLFPLRPVSSSIEVNVLQLVRPRKSRRKPKKDGEEDARATGAAGVLVFLRLSDCAVRTMVDSLFHQWFVFNISGLVYQMCVLLISHGNSVKDITLVV